MARGIAKIKWTGIGEVVSSLSVPNVKLTVKADQFVHFTVAEWFKNTTPSDKTSRRFWTFHAHDKKIVLMQQVLAHDKTFGIKIAKKFCGPYCYYLQANLSENREFTKTGLSIRGYCPPRITTSKWCLSNDGEDVRSSHTFAYGNIIYLTINTEGLNGYNSLIVEVYRQFGGSSTNDDPLIAVISKVKVTNGEIDLSINNTSLWYSKVKNRKPIERFYVKVKDPATNTYIRNDKNEIAHAEFLKIKDKLEYQPPRPPENLTPLKVGEAEASYKKYELCKFPKVVIYEDNEPVTIFDEGKFNRQIDGKERFVVTKKINYDFDKYNIRPDAKSVIDDITTFLLESPYLPVEIGSHTDCRGSEEYNIKLSLNRAQTIVDHLVEKGIDPDRITAKGYGKTALIHHGENISEGLHEQNRRTTLLFKVYGNNAQPITVDIIAPTYSHAKKLKINVPKQSFDSCFKEHKEKHSIRKTVFEHTQLSVNKKTVYNAEIIEHPVFSVIGSDFKTNYLNYLAKYLNPFSDKTTSYFDITNDYYFHINSCAYYSDKSKPTLHIKAYPDVVWVGHFQYRDIEKYKEPLDYFFYKKEVALKREIKQEIEELTDSLGWKILRLLPSNLITEHVLFPYMKKQAENFGIGLHAFYDRKLEKKGEDLSLTGTQVDFIKENKHTRYLVAIAIYEMVAVGILIELLMIYLTRGRNIPGKLKKAKKVAKTIEEISKKLDEIGIELYPPNIGMNAGMYYKMQADSRLALIFEANIKCAPLVAVGFKRDFDLIEYLKNNDETPQKSKDPEEEKKRKQLRENKKVVSTALEKMGVTKIGGIITILGEIGFEQKVKHNFLTKTYTITDNAKNYVNNKLAVSIVSTMINAKIVIEAKYEKAFAKFTPIETKVEGGIKIKMEGSATLKNQYGIDPKKGLFMEQYLIFSGIKGVYLTYVELKTESGFKIGTSEKQATPIPFTLIEPSEKSLMKIYFFNT
ncbi:OmpA family protein [Flavobacterium sp. H122]|uniref:OmpA family protein n=1 Tax=Flavobacterium sp. H122 TaxID=2529860 RepID=UPI0010AB493E|nr:OmpA family protein [Flavobacterium sp. H122]